MHRLVRILVASAAVVAMIRPAAAEELEIVNKSKVDIHHIFISPANQKAWGPDQLGADSIEPGARFTINKIPTGTYDLKLVDEDGTECVLEDVAIDEGKVWTITGKILNACADWDSE